eukprot:g3077.t1
MNAAQTLLLHPDLKFVIPEFLEPQCRFNARIALRHKTGWIPKQVLKYVEEKTEKGVSLTYRHLIEVVKENNFEVVKWAGTFNEFVKKHLCEEAAEQGQLHMIQWSRQQQPPLFLDADSCQNAFDNGHYNTLKWMVKNGCKWYEEESIDFMKYVNIFEAEETWKKVEVNQNFYRPFDYTILIVACNFGHERLVEHLLSRSGINVNMMCDDDCALFVACRNNQMEVLKLLLAHEDLNVNQQSSDSFTALHIASREGHYNIVELLLQHPKICDYGAASEALEYGHYAIAELLEMFNK